MKIKVTYQCGLVGELIFNTDMAIGVMRKLGFASFSVRSKIRKYEYFATFRNEDTEDYIHFYPDKSIMKRKDYRITYEELRAIREIIDYCIDYTPYEEESE